MPLALFVVLTIVALAGAPYMLQSCYKMTPGRSRTLAISAIVGAIPFYLYIAHEYWVNNPGFSTDYMFSFIFVCALFSIAASIPTNE